MNKWWEERLTKLFDGLLLAAVMTLLTKVGASIADEQPWLIWIDNTIRWWMVGFIILLTIVLAIILGQIHALTNTWLIRLFKRKMEPEHPPAIYTPAMVEVKPTEPGRERFDIERHKVIKTNFNAAAITPVSNEVYSFTASPSDKEVTLNIKGKPFVYAHPPLNKNLVRASFTFLPSSITDRFNLAFVLSKAQNESDLLINRFNDLALCITKPTEDGIIYFTVRYSNVLEEHGSRALINPSRITVQVGIFKNQNQELLCVVDVNGTPAIVHPINRDQLRLFRLCVWPFDTDVTFLIDHFKGQMATRS